MRALMRNATRVLTRNRGPVCLVNRLQDWVTSALAMAVTFRPVLPLVAARTSLSTTSLLCAKPTLTRLMPARCAPNHPMGAHWRRARPRSCSTISKPAASATQSTAEAQSQQDPQMSSSEARRHRAEAAMPSWKNAKIRRPKNDLR